MLVLVHIDITSISAPLDISIPSIPKGATWQELVEQDSCEFVKYLVPGSRPDGLL